MNPYPAAVAFDLDGTLIDTEGYYNDAARVMTHESGGTWGHEEDDLVVGMSLEDLARSSRDIPTTRSSSSCPQVPPDSWVITRAASL